MDTEDKSPKARESQACCQNGMAELRARDGESNIDHEGYRGEAKRRALHLEGSEEPLEAGMGMPGPAEDSKRSPLR